MFDFFKKSRAFKFLCSACLLCSLGSFAVSADDESTSNVPVKIATAYVQGRLGIEPNHIMLDGATIDDNGLMSNGTLKYYTAATENRYSKGIYENKTLDEIWTIFNENFLNESEYDSFILLYEQICSKAIDLGYEFEHVENTTHIVKFPDGSIHNYNEYAIMIPEISNSFYSYADKATIEDMILSVGWELSSTVNLENYSTLQNSNENSILGLSLESEGNPVGATKAIDLTNKNFSLANVQFYQSTTGDVIEDESTPTLSCKPGVYDLMGILTKKGDKTIISGPVADNSDES